MAVSRLKVWGTEILFSADLNAEFNNILNNGTDVAFPLTKNVSFAGFNATSVGDITHLASQDQWSKGVDIVSAGTIALLTDGNYWHVTGGTTITSITSPQAGLVFALTFDGALTLTHNATSLILPGGVNITTAAGDTVIFVAETTANVRALTYQPAAGTAIIAPSPTGSQIIDDFGFTAAVAGNALTFTATRRDGTALSAANPARIAFRSATLTTGQYILRSITSAITLTVSSGSTLGTASGVLARLYLLAIDNAGTVELAVWNPYVTTGPTLKGINESDVITTTAEGGAGASDSAQVAYSTTARAGVAVRVVGYIEISEATAGTWATAPTVLQIMGPGVRKTGDRVQILKTSTGAVATGTTVMPEDDTIPQITEGDEYMTVTLTPASIINILEMHILGMFACSVARRLISAIFQDTTAGALAVFSEEVNVGDNLTTIKAQFIRRADTVSSTVFRFRVGPHAAATLTLNGAAAARYFGGQAYSSFTVEEIFV
jgi:hypothetical protein